MKFKENFFQLKMCEDISYVPIKRDNLDFKDRYKLLKAEYNNNKDLTSDKLYITIESTPIFSDNYNCYIDAICILKEFTIIGQLEIVNGIDVIFHDNNEHITKFIQFLRLKYYNPTDNN